MITTIHIASDHAGFEMKTALVSYLQQRGIDVIDHGPHSSDSVDYPDYGKKIAETLQGKPANVGGVLMCGSGVGMSISANRFKGVRAGLAWTKEIAALTRLHNNANVLVLPARFISHTDATEILDVWLATEFEGGRHERRVNKLDS